MHRNPFLTTLLTIACLGGVLAIVTLAVGLTPSPDPLGYADDPFFLLKDIGARGPLVAIGCGLLSLSITALLFWLHASAVLWKEPKDAEKNA